jgi:hypothetical protein
VRLEVDLLAWEGSIVVDGGEAGPRVTGIGDGELFPCIEGGKDWDDRRRVAIFCVYRPKDPPGGSEPKEWGREEGLYSEPWKRFQPCRRQTLCN